MKVKELIAHLKDMPQEAEIDMEIIGFRGYEQMSCTPDAEISVYETADDRVCIQAVD